MRPVFNRRTQDPAKFDLDGLCWLQERYSSLLWQVRRRFQEDTWFESQLLEHDSLHTTEWNIIARQLIAGFASAELIGVPPVELDELWLQYCRVRIQPILRMNCVLDTEHHQSINEALLESFKASLQAIAAQARGFTTFSRIPGGTAFMGEYVKSLARMSESIYEDLATRYSYASLERCNDLLNAFDSEKTPLMRRSTIEAFIHGISKMQGRTMINCAWPIEYDQMSQLLDDLSDIWEDILAGRLTYPVLLGLSRNYHTRELHKIIFEIWSKCCQKNPPNVMKCSYWPKIKELLQVCSALEDTSCRVSCWIDQIRSEIINSQVSGDKGPMLVLVDLKAAFNARLEDMGYNDKKPEFTFYIKSS